MHYWGDDWEHWDTLYKVIDDVNNNLRKYHIGVYIKEKYGTMRLDFLHYWDGTIHGWFRPSYAVYRDFWVREIFGMKLFVLDKRISKILFRPWFVRLVHKWQHKHHYAIIERVCLKHPEIIDEVLFDSGLMKEKQNKIKERVKNDENKK